jgi:hypothetical protein
LSDTPPPAPDTGIPPPPPPAAAPWYNGVTDAEFIGTVQNRGLDKKDALTAAQDFYKAHREATQMISRITGTPDKDRIIITPKPDATQTEKDAYYQKLGRPAKAEEYDFTGLKFPDGDDLDNEFVSTLKNAAFKANVSKEGAAAIAKDLIDWMGKGAEADKLHEANEKQAADQALRKLWGGNFQAFEFMANNAYAKLAQASGMTPEAAKKGLDAIGNAAGKVEALQMLVALAKMTGEDQYISSGQGMNTGIMTSEQAAAKMAELRSERGPDSFGAKLMRGDRAAKEQFEALTAMMVGQAA